MNRKPHRYLTELEFAEYIQYTDVQIFAGSPIYHLPGNVKPATVGSVYTNL